jgi:hypothetical protein
MILIAVACSTIQLRVDYLHDRFIRFIHHQSFTRFSLSSYAYRYTSILPCGEPVNCLYGNGKKSNPNQRSARTIFTATTIDDGKVKGEDVPVRQSIPRYIAVIVD